MNHYTSFNVIIGQEPHKLYFHNLLGANKKSSTMLPPLAVDGERGAGKTTMLKAIIGGLKENHPNMAILPQPESDSLDTLPTPNAIRGENGDQSAMRSFFNDLSVCLGNDLAVCIVLDEFHLLGKGPNYSPATFKHLFEFLMKITIFSLEGRCGTIEIEGNHYTWNPSKHFCLFATNYPEKINPALLSRCRRVSIANCTPDELRAIAMAKFKSKGWRVVEESIKPIVNLCRNTPRELDRVMGEIGAVIGNQEKETVNKADVLTAMRGMQVYPHGFTKDFVRLLAKLEKEVCTTPHLQALFLSIADSIPHELCVASDKKLVYRTNKGWSLTSKGIDDLRAWKREGFEW